MIVFENGKVQAVDVCVLNILFFCFTHFPHPAPSVEMYRFIKAVELNLTVSAAMVLLQNLNQCFITFAFNGVTLALFLRP